MVRALTVMTGSDPHPADESVGFQALGLLAFARTLGNHPAPDVVASALAHGPLADLGVRSALISQLAQDRLETLGAWGLSPTRIDTWRGIDMSLDVPLTRCVRENEVLIGTDSDLADEYAGLESADLAWQDFRETSPFGSLVCAPIVLRGLAVGAFGFTCSSERNWSTLEIAHLDAVSALLGLWLTHPRTPGILATTSHRLPVSSANLTGRQRQILAGVHHGRSTTSIARELGVSASTVKQDTAKAVRALGASTRQDAARIAIEHGLVP